MDRNKFFDDFEKKCRGFQTKCLTNISKIDYLSQGINVDYECENGHQYKSNIGHPACEICVTNQKEFYKRKLLVDEQIKKDCFRKIKNGMKIVSNTIEDDCFESSPCQHCAHVVLEDGSVTNFFISDTHSDTHPSIIHNDDGNINKISNDYIVKFIIGNDGF